VILVTFGDAWLSRTPGFLLAAGVKCRKFDASAQRMRYWSSETPSTRLWWRDGIGSHKEWFPPSKSR